jgi:hypothetical protein
VERRVARGPHARPRVETSRVAIAPRVAPQSPKRSSAPCLSLTSHLLARPCSLS